MKKFILRSLILFWTCYPVLVFADTEIISPETWTLYKGTVIVKPRVAYASKMECQAAAPFGVQHKCQGSETFVRRADPVPTCTTPQPSTETQSVACPVGTTGTWQQSRSYIAAAYPTCWTAGDWTPSAAPTGACTPVVVTPPTSPVAGISTTFDAYYASSFTLKALAADAIPTVAKPASKATGLATPSYTDPVYGTRVYKATDGADYAGASFVRHDYSRRQAFNADNTRFLGIASNGYWLLYDATTFQRLQRSGTGGALKGLAGDAEAIWHPTDPAKLFYTGNTGGMVWYEKNVETDTDTVMANFSGRLPWSGVTSVWTKAEGTSSADGRYFAFMATSYNSASQSNVIYGLFTYDRVLDKIIGTLDASKFGGAFPDHISISASGKYAVPSWAYNKTLGTRAYSLDFSTYTQLHTQSEHSDLAFGPNGEDYYVVTDYDSGYIRAVDMATGSSFNLMPLYPATGVGYSAHVSGKAFGRPGWVLISTYADFANYGSTYPDTGVRPMTRKVMLVELKAGGRQLSVAHTRAAAGYGGYFGEHQATISRDGTRVIFATNFNDGGVPSSYVIGLPSWAIPK